MKIKRLKIQHILLILIFAVLGFYSYFVEPNQLEIKRYVIKDKELSGIKIVFPADFHARPYQRERLERIVEIINSEKPDIVLSVGDFPAGHTKNVTMQIEEIAEILSKINCKGGFYTTLGNHDGWYGNDRIKQALSAHNIKVLDNENVKIKLKGKDVYIAGVEDMMTGSPKLYEALSGVKTPVILLTHTPDMFPKVPEYVNLTLAGHTHGGQIRIPFIGAIFTASKYFNRYVMGLIDENGKKMIVTRGLGVSIIPVRFNCLPELTVIEFE